MSVMIDFDPVECNFIEPVMIDKIVRLSKHENGETTFIHLMDGTKVESHDSINTLQARIESAAKECCQ